MNCNVRHVDPLQLSVNLHINDTDNSLYCCRYTLYIHYNPCSVELSVRIHSSFEVDFSASNDEKIGLPSKHETSTKYCTNVDPPSTTLAQHWPNIGSGVCWVCQFKQSKCIMTTSDFRRYTNDSSYVKLRQGHYLQFYADILCNG